MKTIAMLMAVLMLAGAAGCGKKDEAPEKTPAAEQVPEAKTEVAEEITPSILTEMKNATYEGVEEHGPLTLKDGIWEGEPYTEDGASRPRVTFLRDFHRLGDLDRDGLDEVAVILAASSGGTGENIYLAVLGRREGQLVNLDTVLIGDRVQVRKAGILEGRLFMDILRAGKGDAMSNPGELAVMAWTLDKDKLVPMDATSKPLRLTLDAITGNEWVLTWWDFEEKAPAEPEVMLVYTEGRLSGKSGCNNWFTEPKAGEAPGQLSVGPTGGTMMMCPDEVMAVERRFLSQLEGVNKFGYMATMLALSYEMDGQHGVMLFERRDVK